MTDKDKSILNMIKQKQLQHNLTFIKGDKGNCTVIMKTNDLQEKAYTFFKENRISELPQDPTISYEKILKNTIYQCTHIVPNTQKPYFKQIKPTAPKLNTLPKIHKEKIPNQSPSKQHHSTSIQTGQTHVPCNKIKHKIPKSQSH
jgi:hypothetical protein